MHYNVHTWPAETLQKLESVPGQDREAQSPTRMLDPQMTESESLHERESERESWMIMIDG